MSEHHTPHTRQSSTECFAVRFWVLTLLMFSLCWASVTWASSPSPPAIEDTTTYAFEAQSIRRASLERAPSFSPYTRVTHAWSRQGSWLLSSTEAAWPPPWPKWTASALLDRAAGNELREVLQRASVEGVSVSCPPANAPLRRGQALLRVVSEQRDGSERLFCYSVEEDLDIGRFAAPVEALYAFSPPVESVDRWSHPFWLQDESGVLRIELRGTADLEIGPLLVGRVNGVLTLRLPVGPYDLTLRPADGAKPREERVVLRRDQVTVLRISVEATAMGEVPSWTQRPLPVP